MKGSARGNWDSREVQQPFWARGPHHHVEAAVELVQLVSARYFTLNILVIFFYFLILCCFRDDGKDALKIYTDPDYFFNLWREAMQKEMRNAKEKRREKREKVVSIKLRHLSSRLKHDSRMQFHKIKDYSAYIKRAYSFHGTGHSLPI